MAVQNYVPEQEKQLFNMYRQPKAYPTNFLLKWGEIQIHMQMNT